MDPTFDIRPFELADLPALHTIRTAAFEPVFQSFRDILGPAIAGVALATAAQEQADHLQDLCSPDTPHRTSSSGRTARRSASPA